MIIHTIKNNLAKYPGVRFTENENSIRIHPNDGGFEVGVSINPGTFTVFFEGWHEDFQDEDKALKCMRFGLSQSCRLRVFRKGKVDYHWIVESLNGKEWLQDSEVGLLIFPFWKIKQERVLQNRLVDAA